MKNKIIFDDNLTVLQQLPDGLIDLIYIDPPFNTGRQPARQQKEVEKDAEGDRVGFGGNRYHPRVIGEKAYRDHFDDILGFLEPRLLEAYRVLAETGSRYFHIDYREVHYCKILIDEIFGRESLINEIIWAYDFGGRSKTRWPAKHDNILCYAQNTRQYTFNCAPLERIPYMAPGLVGKDKAARGKFPTDTLGHTIVGTNSIEKSGYPTQKPVGVLKRIVSASSYPGDLVLDFFAGSGTVGEVCLELERRFILVDNNPQAIAVMQTRFSENDSIEWVGVEPQSAL